MGNSTTRTKVTANVLGKNIINYKITITGENNVRCNN